MEKAVNKNRQLALIGALSALVAVLGITRLGFLSLSPTVSLTILHIPVIIAAILAGLPGGLVTGAVFGIFSLIHAAIEPTGTLTPLFVNPFISVVPRMLFGLAAWALWKGFTAIPYFPKTAAAPIAAFAATVTHTCLVIGAIYLFYYDQIFKTMGNAGYFAGLLALLPHAALEAFAAAIVCTVVIATLTVAGVAKSKLSSETGGSNKPE